MKKEDLFELMGNIDEKYVVEAENYKKAKIDTRIFKYIGIAASVILVAGILMIVISVAKSSQSGHSSYSTSATTTSPRDTESTGNNEAPDYQQTNETGATTTLPSREAEDTTTTTSDQSSEPTGVSSGMIEQPMIMYKGKIYKFSTSPLSKKLPEGFKFVGVIEKYDPENIPTEDFQATGTDLCVGQDIFANPKNPNEIYVRYDLGGDWTGYGSFYTTDVD